MYKSLESIITYFYPFLCFFKMFMRYIKGDLYSSDSTLGLVTSSLEFNISVIAKKILDSPHANKRIYMIIVSICFPSLRFSLPSADAYPYLKQVST